MHLHVFSLPQTLQVISALSHIRSECGHASAMSLFHTVVGKPLKLEEFEQTQSQAALQVNGQEFTDVCACVDYATNVVNNLDLVKLSYNIKIERTYPTKH